MEQSTTRHDAVDDGMLSVHRWRVSQLTRLGIPGRWPRCMPTASTGIRSPGWCGVAARHGSPCASFADPGRVEPTR
jgi:hypothetical protein